MSPTSPDGLRFAHLLSLFALRLLGNVGFPKIFGLSGSVLLFRGNSGRVGSFLFQSNLMKPLRAEGKKCQPTVLAPRFTGFLYQPVLSVSGGH